MKPGYLTTEFWLSTIAVVLTQLGALDIPDRFKWIVTIGAIVGYAISRGLAKLGPAAPPVIGPALPPEYVDPVAAELASQKAQALGAEA